MRDSIVAPVGPGPRLAPRITARALGPGLAALLAFLAAACTTPREYYERAVAVVDQVDRPDADEAAGALDDLDECVAAAREQLDTESERPTASRHDRLAYLVPLAHLARARLHGRLGQVVRQERACWDAVQSSEVYLGKHIQILYEENEKEKGDEKRKTGPLLPFVDYSVYFRREKIRRNAFSQLIETYRQAGERDLEVLMRAQVGLSDIYLRSPTAHAEEEYIRTIENSDWIQRNAVKRENVGYTAKVVGWGIYMVLQRATQAVQRAQLEQQVAAARDPEVRADLEQRLAALDARQRVDAEAAREVMRSIHRQHDTNLETIRNRFRKTVFGALSANFELLGVSNEVKRLTSYRRLQRKKEAFDNYVLRAGFDRKAAQALADLRSSLDQLSRDLQQRRRKKG